MKTIAALVLVASVLAAGVPVRAAPASYAQVKAAIVAVRARDPHKSVERGAATYDVENCQLGSDFIGDHNESAKMTRAGVYADIANYVAVWEANLPRVGYPARVWRAWTSDYEAKAIATANAVAPSKFYEAWTDPRAPSLDGLKKVLLAYRKTHPHAAAVINAGGCGAGEEEVKLVTQPVATQVSIIPTFFYELCRVQRIDPNDTNRCAHWREVSGTVTQVSGNYHYIAKWHDGTVKRGMLNVDSALESGTITLRKP